MAGKLFSDFTELSQPTKDVLASLGFERATPVQEATIPVFSGNKDVAVDACTGSGKTLAFVIPIIEKLRKLDRPLKRHQVGAVVISPTRELSKQIYDVAQPFADSLPWLTSALLVGGTDPAADVAALRERGAHLLVGTPGRLDDVLQRCPFLDLKTVEVLVLDEADRLLDMGFKAQVDSLMARLPRQRRTGLFSATQTEAVEALARAGLRNPLRVAVAVTLLEDPADGRKGGKKRKAGEEGVAARAVQITPSTLSVLYTVVDPGQKIEQLAAFLAAHAQEKVIVYFLTCACVDYYALVLPKVVGRGVALRALHGRMKQAAREATLAGFAGAESGVLLATDVAARGLDIPDVHWVVQADPPQDPSAFVHRCGRTARMGRSGSALVYLTPTELSYVEFLKLRKVPLVEAPLLALTTMTATTKKKEKVLEEGEEVTALLRREAESDREVMEAGTRAFVSYIRAYKEHHCKFIFRVEDLAMGHLAAAFSLLRLPKMQEIKKAARAANAGELEGWTESSVDFDAIKFKDKAREKQRQALLKTRAAKTAEEEEEGAAAKRAAREKGASAREQQQRERDTAAGRLTAAKRRQLEARQELVELNDEYAMLRKLKKGKISESDYEAAAGLTEPLAAAKGGSAAAAKNKGGQLPVAPKRNNLVSEAIAKKAKKKLRKERKKVERQQLAQQAEKGQSGTCVEK